MLKFFKSCTLLALLGSPVYGLLAEESGEKLFGQCRACHQVGPEAKHQFGPILNGVMDQGAASASDYPFSDAFKKAAEAGLEWDDKSMSEFLESPMQTIKGTKMAFVGVSDPEHRSALIEYLRSFNKDGTSALATEPVAEEPATTAPQKRPLASDFAVPKHGELHLGRIALPDEVAAWDIDVRPDGLGLPEGSGDVLTGTDVYDAQCAACHGDFGEGINRWPVLAGGHDTLTHERPEKTIGSYWPYLSTVYDYVRRAMPFGNARNLSDDEVYAVTAYLLYLNDIVEEDFTLSSENFGSITLPNEPNFIDDNRKTEAFRSITEAELCMIDCLESPAKVVQRARVLDVTPDD